MERYNAKWIINMCEISFVVNYVHEIKIIIHVLNINNLISELSFVALSI